MNDFVSLKVEGMSCSHCENSIKKMFETMNGVNFINIDLNTKKVLVDFDCEKISSQMIKDKIEDLGYSVK